MIKNFNDRSSTPLKPIFIVPKYTKIRLFLKFFTNLIKISSQQLDNVNRNYSTIKTNQMLKISENKLK